MADAPSPHGLNSAHHTGTLDNSQIPQALLTDGSRTLAGNLAVSSGVTVDGVDISVLKNNYDTHLGDPLGHNYIRNLLDDSNVAADKGVTTNDVRIYGDGDITVTKTVDGLLIAYAGGGGGGGGSFSGIKDPAGTGVVEDGLGWILTTDDNVVNVAASGANTLAFSLNQAGITHNNLAGLTTGHPHAQYPLLSGTETVTGLWSFSRSTSAPFAVNSGAAVVANLDADKVDGYHMDQDVRTTASPQFAAINVGHATDTTIARVSAGLISVEGDTVALLTATQTLSAKTLTLPQINDTSADHQYVFAVSELIADRTVTLPLLTGNDTFVFADFVQTLTNKTISADSNTLSGIAASSFVVSNASGYIDGSAAQKAIPSGVVVGTTDTQTLSAKTLTLPQINDTSADHQYVFAVSELLADRTVTLPLLTGNDVFVFADFIQTLTNKTISADSNTLSGIAASSFVVSNASGYIDGSAAQKAIPSGVVVGTTDTQTLSAKTLTLPQINDTSADHQYVFAVSELLADRTVTLPLLTGNDVFVFADFTQVLANKTLTTPTISGTGFTNAQHAHAGASSGGQIAHTALTSIGTNTHAQIDTHIALTDEHVAHSGVTLTAGAGLTGGGTIAASRTFAVGAGTMITVNADDVQVSAGATYQFIGTGSGTAAGWRNVSELAGAGLTAATGVLAVGAGLGITVNADDVALTTPGTLTVSTANNSTGSHLHAITSSSNPGAAASLLASSGAGALTLVNLTATTDVVAPLVRATTGVALTLGAGTDVILSPTSLLTKMASGVSIQSSAYASQTTGWRATDAGEADFRYLFVDEMHAKSFIADLEQALAGGQIISKSVAMVASDFTLPTAGNTGTLRVRDLPSAPNMAVFVSGDFVGMRQFSRAAGSLTIGWAWGTVTSYTDGTGGNEGTQTWTFTRSATAGAATGTISADSLVLDFGTTGNGFYEVNAIDGAYGANSPYAQVVTWATHPATQTVRARFGHLKGIFSVTDEHGLYAGSGTAVTDRYVRASSYAVELRNVPLALYDGANNTMLLSAGAGNNAPVLAMGATLPTGPLVGSGLWMGKDGSDYEFRVGTVSGGVLTAGMHWDGTNLNVSGGGTFTGTVSGGAIVGGVIDIGGADATSFHVDSAGQMWLGHADYASAPFKVSAAGVVAAVSGTVGGWALSSTTLTGTNVTLGSSGYATFGSGSNILKIDTTSPSEIFWIGHATFASAPFRVSAAGAFTADNASITTTNTGLHILDTGADHDLIITPGENFSADRTLSLVTGNANRTLTLSGNPTLSDWFDQDVKTTGSPAFLSPKVRNDTSGAATFVIDNRDAAGTSIIYFTQDGVSTKYADIAMFNDTHATTAIRNGMQLRTRNSGNIFLMPAGNVLVGTTTSNGYKLEVSGSVYSTQMTVDNLRLDGNVLSSISGAVTVTPLAGQNLNVSLSTTGDFVVNTNQFVVDTSAGKIGIGTATAIGKLTLQDDGGSTSITIRNYLTGDVADQYSQITGGRISNGNSFLSFSTTTGGSVGEKVRIDNAGYVGIGTTSPAGPLHLEAAGGAFVYIVRNDSIVANGGLRLRGSDNLTDAYISYNNEVSSSWAFGTGAGGATTRMVILDSGYVGINDTTPSYSLDVNGIGAFSGGLRAGVSSNTAYDALYLQNTSNGTSAVTRISMRNDVTEALIVDVFSSTYSGSVDGVNYANLTRIIGVAQSSGLMLGTSSTDPLYFVTNNLVRGTFDSSGNFLVDTNVLYVDAVNNRVGINKTPGAYDLDVNGDANVGSSLEVGLDLYTSSVRAITDGTLAIKFSGNASPSYAMAVDTTNSRVAIGEGHTASYTLDVLGAIKYSTHMRIAETASTPASLSSSAEGAIYIKSDKLIIAFNDGGTVRYKYLDLTSTGVTWVHTTTAP